jgi:hypothetical protein
MELEALESPCLVGMQAKTTHRLGDGVDIEKHAGWLNRG